MTQSSRWKAIIKYVLAFALLALVIGLNWTKLNQLFSREPHYSYLAAAFVLFACVVFVQFTRWYILVRALDLPFTFRNACRLGMVGLFYNAFLPGAIGGDFVKAYSIAKGEPKRKASAVATVVADRLLGLFGLILFAGGVGGGFWLSGDAKFANNRSLQIIVIVCAILAVCAIVGYLLLGFVSRQRAERVGGRLLKVPKVGPTLAELWFTIWQYRQRPGTILMAIGLSAIAHLAMILVFHCSVHIFPPEDRTQLGTLGEHFVIAPLGYMAQAIIPLPGGIGGGELTFGGLYELIRPGASAVGLAGRLALRLPEWTIGLLGYFAYLRMKDELPVTENVIEEVERDIEDGLEDQQT